ncbi:MAG TPA: DUF4265 domain-containing protein [Luteibacter sp.]|uniref:DUF4265 domain-containing protein n=1 Tax=Luteibacter sp. TaxID=1886636 RepID=UPI002BCEF5E6|nr:DUF4265 domain-containing protein [Luteibacter sp.]HVI56635.1 DUF4265 domain-containing protein [Luteibacter sp.]
MEKQLKVIFSLKQDEDDYPGFASESVWALATADASVVQIDNIPFFTYAATLDDLIRVRNEDGQLWFEDVHKASANSLVRVVFFKEEAKDNVKDVLVRLGCRAEYFAQRKLLAVSVPSAKLLPLVREFLENEVQAGNIDYEEAIVRE